MGIIKWFSSSAYDNKKQATVVIERPVYIDREKKDLKLPNPDPFNYIINKNYQMGSYLLVDITYPDCTNYEGRKLLLYENTTIVGLKKQRHIDPHFSSNKKFHSPIARFEPTEDGWNMAIKLIDILSK